MRRASLKSDASASPYYDFCFNCLTYLVFAMPFVREACSCLHVSTEADISAHLQLRLELDIFQRFHQNPPPLVAQVEAPLTLTRFNTSVGESNRQYLNIS